MKISHNTKRFSRKAETRLPDLFGWARQSEPHPHPTIQTIVRHAGVSPAVAAIIAELAGLTTEVHHG
jgi:hypothetical protein